MTIQNNIFNEQIAIVRYYAWLGIIMFVGFSLVDLYVFYDTIFLELWTRRFLAILFMAVFLIALYQESLKYYWPYIIGLFILSAGLGLIAMMPLIVDPLKHVLYSAGLIIVVYFSYSISQLPLKVMLFIGVIISLTYLFLELYLDTISIEYIVTHLVFQISANIFGGIALAQNQKLLIQEFNLHNENQTNIEQLKLANVNLEKLAITDKLTQIYNRLKLDVLLNEQYELFSREQVLSSILLLDIDHFKSVNDTFGHNTGDIILQEFSTLIKKIIRKNDVVGRWGGEEFLIICEKTNIADGILLAEKIRSKIEQYNFTEIGHMTASIGISEFKNSQSVKDLVSQADNALYRAKNSGRNQVFSAVS